MCRSRPACAASSAWGTPSGQSMRTDIRRRGLPKTKLQGLA